MDVINELTDFQLNKLIFFRDAGYSKNTKTSYWRMYLNYISNLEVKYNKDLYDFSQDEIDFYKQKIKDKSNQTILQFSAFIKKYIAWYSKFYNQPIKAFDLTFSKEKDDSWYISKNEFFKLCDTMIKKNVAMFNIIPLLLARYGIVGKEACYIRNLQWEDINLKNKEISIYNSNRTKVISKIPIDDKFIEFIEIINISEEAYNEKEVKNRHIVKTQIKENEIINYQTLNSKVYKVFNSIKIKRISFTTLFNCAIIDHISKTYSKHVPRSNDEFIKSLLLYYPEEKLDVLKVATIKKLYSEVTGDESTLNTRGRRNVVSNTIKKDTIIYDLKPVEVKARKPKNISKNEIVIDGNSTYIFIKKISEYEKVKINKNIIKKIENYKWYFNIRGYVVARKRVGDRLTIIHLANFILDKSECYHIKHLNGDKLDCTLKNLEVGDLY